MAKNIYDTIVSVGGFAGEYEALTEVEISDTPGAPYAPPEEFENFRVVAARTVQLLGGSPIFFETFQTSACTLKLPCGTIGINDAQDGRLYFFRNSGTGIVTLETCGVGTSPVTIIKLLRSGNITIVLHGDNDQWNAIRIDDSGAAYRYSNNNGIPNGGTRYLRTGQGVRCSAVGDILPFDYTLKAVTIAVNESDGSNDYSVEVLSDPAGSPIILASFSLPSGTRILNVPFAVPISEGSEIGIRMVRTAGGGSSDFDEANVTILLERT